MEIQSWLPLFNDITTDLENPPLLYAVKERGLNREAPIPFPAEKNLLFAFVYADIKPLEIPLTRQSVFELCETVASGLKRWRQVGRDPNACWCQYEVVSPLFRFRDDLCFHVRSAGEARGCIVQLRSRSRVGLTDLGANSRRIRYFLQRLEESSIHLIRLQKNNQQSEL